MSVVIEVPWVRGTYGLDGGGRGNVWVKGELLYIITSYYIELYIIIKHIIIS